MIFLLRKGKMKFKSRKSGGTWRDYEAYPEVKEMWEKMASSDSEVCVLLLMKYQIF